MMIGVPYSGKSTWYSQTMDFRAKRTDCNKSVLIDTDSILEEYAGKDHTSYHQAFFRYGKKASKEMFRRVPLAVAKNYDIFWDQTNMTRKSRARKLIMLPDYYLKFAIVFKQPTPEELEERRAKRPNKNIANHIIDAMTAQYEPPELSEGFDAIDYTISILT